MSGPSTVSGVAVPARIARGAGGDGQTRQGGSAFDHLSIGQNLKLQVLRQLDRERYEVSLAGSRHVVESRVPLEPGAQIEAQVEGLGEQLQLKYLNTQARPAIPDAPLDAEAAAQPAVPEWIGALAAQHRVTLDAASGVTIARSAAGAGQPELMTRCGLFLRKLDQGITPRDLQSLYGAASAGARAAANLADKPLVKVEPAKDRDDLAAALHEALDAALPETNAAMLAPTPQDGGADSDGGDDGARRALRLLNLQDEGSVAWRYGSLPLLIDGKLVELDVVMFAEREKPAARGQLRRLVMSLDTTHFGRVQVEARAIDNRLIVRLGAGTADAVETLASYGADVRAAVERLGWSVDEIRYDLDAPQLGAAHEVIRHVLSTGTVDQEM